MNVGMEYEDILMRNQELRMLVEQLTAQRNEARKEVCLWQGLDTGKKSEEVAKVRGWDCFEQPKTNEQKAMDRLAQLDEEMGLN